MSDDLDRLIDQVAELSVPGRATIEGGVDARAILGVFLIRCRDSLLAVRVLSSAGLERVVDPLVRTTIEFAATSGWLMSDPERHFSVMMDASRRDLRLAIEEHESAGGASPASQTDALAFLDAGPGTARLPSLPDRARIAGLTHWYASYRLLSATTHGSMLGAFSGARVRHEGEMVETRSYRRSALIVCAMSLFVARLANTTFAWGRDEALLAAQAQLESLAEPSSRSSP